MLFGGHKDRLSSHECSGLDTNGVSGKENGLGVFTLQMVTKTKMASNSTYVHLQKFDENIGIIRLITYGLQWEKE